MYKTILYIASVLIVFVQSKHNSNSKRILLSDPDIINAKLLSLERRINELETENNNLKRLDIEKENRLTTLETENNNLKRLDIEKRLTTLETENNGAIFIRWGRKDCPNVNGTTLVYTGIAGGGDYNEKGSGANRLCLPHDPDSISASAIHLQGANTYAKVYATEYQFSYKNMVIQDDAPCAVCRVNGATTPLMIPAKSSCPTGWLQQYNGVLVGNYYDYSASEFVCLDDDPHIFEGRRASTDGNLFYPAVSVCGTLPCPYYGDLKYLPCVLCTK